MDKAPRSYSLVSRLRGMLWAMMLLPVLAGLAFFLLHSSRTLQAAAVRDLHATLGLERQFIETWVAERAADIGFLASDPRMRALPAPALTEMFAAVLAHSPDFEDIAYVDEHGITRADPRRAPGLDVSDREYFQAARQGHSLVSDVLISRRTGRQVFFVTSPVHDTQGAFRGLIFGSISLDRLSSLLRTVQAETAVRSFLLRVDGEAIAPVGRKAGLRQGDALFDAALARRELKGVYRSAEGRRVVGAYQWINGERWLLAAERPESDILAAHALVLGVPLAGALLVFLLFGPAVLRMAKSLRQPVRDLEAHAREIEAGNFAAQCPVLAGKDAPREIARLSQAYCNMVERMRAAMTDLSRATLTDPLTGAGNRKRLQEEGPRLLEGSLRAGLGASLLMLDLDHFKAVNDTHGHAAGDAVLRAFAALLKSMVRKSDLCVRYGGEEFVVLAPNTPETAAHILAQRIREATARLRLDWAGADIRFTVSVGLASVPAGARREAGPDAEAGLLELARRADEALYAAKAAGRNRVETAPPAPTRGDVDSND